MDRFEAERKRMVDLTVAQRGVTDSAVLAAMQSVPRHLFLPEKLAEFAYRDTPLPIAEEQTISQPYIVALMLEAAQLKHGDKLLEVGTGSGYAAAVAFERHASLAEHAAEKLRTLGYDNVNVPQLARRRRLGDRDGTPRGAHHRPALSQALWRRCLLGGPCQTPGPSGSEAARRLLLARLDSNGGNK